MFSFIVLENKIMHMKNSAKEINPGDYIMAVLSPADRFDAASKVAAQAFKKPTLTVGDIEGTVKSVRRKAYEKKK